jgi:hypothetical protein
LRLLQLPRPQPMPNNETPARGAAQKAARLAAGARNARRWLGAGGKPIAQTLAQRRADRCLVCPKRADPSAFEKLTGAAARAFKLILEIKNQTTLRVEEEEKLGVCSACGCTLEVKIHEPLQHILAETSDEVFTELDEKCWIKTKDQNV